MNDSPMSFDLFLEETSALLGPLTLEQEDRFRALEALYRGWNEKINVISRKDIDGLYRHHVLHSLAIAVYLKERKPEVWQQWQTRSSRVIDVGTGGGFPGIPLAIMFPNVNFTLLDSVGKKLTVAGSVAESLGLENVEIINERAERLNKTSWEYVVSRAVASMVEFWPWVKHLCSKDVLYLRGGDVAAESIALCSRYKMLPHHVTTWPVFGSLKGEYFEEKWLIDIAK